MLVVINAYDIKGALEEDWIVYKFSLASRAAAALLFYSFGKGWKGLMVAETASVVMLGVAMAAGRE